MGLDSFKKKAKNAIKAVALGGTLMAGAPAAAEAQNLSPILGSEFVKQNDGAIRAVTQDMNRIAESGRQAFEDGRGQVREIARDAERVAGAGRRALEDAQRDPNTIEENVRIIANSPEARRLIENSIRFVLDSRQRAQQIAGEAGSAAQSPEAKALIEAGKRRLQAIQQEAQIVARGTLEEAGQRAREITGGQTGGTQFFTEDKDGTWRHRR